MSKIDPKTLSYEGCDLEAMSTASNYYAWLVALMEPYLGDHIVEVGAGSGSFSRQLLKLNPKKFTIIEPTKNMFSRLKENINKSSSDKTSITTHNAYLSKVEKKIAAEKPDSFVYINVFEHIEDDLAELKTVKKTISKGGHIIIFVPALQSLFSEFDESIGHYRRYSKKSLVSLAEKAGLEVVSARYLDMIGIMPWWLSFVVMKRRKLTPRLIGVYDKFFMPVIRTIETIFPAAIGKNVLLIARKK